MKPSGLLAEKEQITVLAKFRIELILLRTTGHQVSLCLHAHETATDGP